MEIYTVPNGNMKLDGGAMFGIIPKSLWQKQYMADENNMVRISMRSLLVVDGDRRILFDNGIGDKQDHKFFSYYYLFGDYTIEGSLGKLGLKVEDITDMVLTHLHFDHCGGSIKYNDDRTAYEPAFPNATYWVSKAQYEWATNPNHRESASFLKENIYPIKESGKLNLIEEEGEILPNISVRIFNGHTEGQIIPLINYHGRTVAFMADLLPASTHIPMPWIMAYDTKPLLSLDDKTRFYKEAVPRDFVLFFEHDLYNECCTLQDTPKGVRVKETFKLSEI
ncbi:MAG: MBL fold metallo-hydrolase [Bacteroidales bacterium]|nr:MBL fold metallo-hydrolase [Bacteroidales bacterium]